MASVAHMQGMDAAYLQREVGGALAKGLAAVTAAQPHDPIDYLGQWLLQYVKNIALDQENIIKEHQLEEEKKKHAEAVEWERMRVEQEEKAKAEAIIAAERAKQQVHLNLVSNFEQKVAHRIEALENDGSATQQQIMPLTMQKERLQVILSEMEANADKIKDLYKMRGIPNGEHPTAKLLKATLVLVGFCVASELSDWVECKRMVRSADIIAEVKKYSPTKKQTVQKFAATSQLIADFPIEDVKKVSYITYLVWEWVSTCLNVRKAALIVRSERLNIPLINDPAFNDGGGEDEEEDLDEELRRSEAAVKKEGDAAANDDEEGDGEGEDDDDEEDED